MEEWFNYLSFFIYNHFKCILNNELTFERVVASGVWFRKDVITSFVCGYEVFLGIDTHEMGHKQLSLSEERKLYGLLAWCRQKNVHAIFFNPEHSIELYYMSNVRYV